ncbi:MAG TPA: hypothetical protein VIM73_07965 [Polyangiaceae bacterium]
MPFSSRSKLGVVAGLLLGVTGLCLWAIPLFAPKAFGIATMWIEPSNYWLMSVLVGVLAAIVAAAFIERKGKLAKLARGTIITLGILLAILAGLTLVYVGLIIFAMRLSRDESVHDPVPRQSEAHAPARAIAL